MKNFFEVTSQCFLFLLIVALMPTCNTSDVYNKPKVTTKTATQGTDTKNTDVVPRGGKVMQNSANDKLISYEILKHEQNYATAPFNEMRNAFDLLVGRNAKKDDVKKLVYYFKEKYMDEGIVEVHVYDTKEAYIHLFDDSYWEKHPEKMENHYLCSMFYDPKHPPETFQWIAE